MAVTISMGRRQGKTFAREIFDRLAENRRTTRRWSGWRRWKARRDSPLDLEMVSDVLKRHYTDARVARLVSSGNPFLKFLPR